MVHGRHADEDTALPLCDIKSADYPGGIRVWPATMPVYDSSDLKDRGTWGWHVHAYDEQGRTPINQTYERVIIDGAEILASSEWPMNHDIKRLLGWLQDQPYCPAELEEGPCLDGKDGHVCPGLGHKTTGWVIETVLRGLKLAADAEGVDIRFLPKPRRSP